MSSVEMKSTLRLRVPFKIAGAWEMLVFGTGGEANAVATAGAAKALAVINVRRLILSSGFFPFTVFTHSTAEI